MMGNLVPSLPQFDKASIPMPGTLFPQDGWQGPSTKIEFCLVYKEVRVFITLLSELVQSLDSNFGKKTQLRDKHAFILHILQGPKLTF